MHASGGLGSQAGRRDSKKIYIAVLEAVVGTKGGDPNGHCPQNCGTADAIVLEIGSRMTGEYVRYSDIDMKPSPASETFTRTVRPIPR